MAKKHINISGYTIVELMVVLAISGAMIVMANNLISGQASRNEFTKSVRDFENKISDVANDVVKGYFPNRGGNEECTATSAGIDFDNTTTVEQGASEDCVFAGKALNFTTGSSVVELQTMVARRVQQDGSEIFSLDDLNTNDIRPAPWLNEEIFLIHGLEIDNVMYSSDTVSSVAFMSSFANRTGDGTGGLSGSTTADVRWIPAAPPNNLTNPGSYMEVTDASGIEICVSHGGNQAIIHIGQNNSSLSTFTEFDVAC